MEEQKTIITIEIPSDDHVAFPLRFEQTKSHCTWIDWGDGSQRGTFEELEINTIHEYPGEGEYEISLFCVDEGTIELVSIGEGGYKNMVTSLIVGKDVTSIAPFCCLRCENLEELVFESDNTYIGDAAFASCISLENINLPNNISVLNIDAFALCTQLKTVNIPENLSIIETNAFYGCSKLTSINLTNIQSIENYAFCGCSKLKNVILTNIKTIGVGAFQNCNNIRKVELGPVENIDESAFSGCQLLTNITIPETITNIGEYAFYDCGFITKIKIEALTPPTLCGVNAFANIDNFDIYIPNGTTAAYSEATNWVVYSEYFKEETI